MKQTSKNIKLGIFTLAGILFLVVLLYAVGKNKNVFGNNFKLRTTFRNVQGLRIGNNVRFAGIDVGTVENLKFLNDSIIEVRFNLKNSLEGIIRNNAIVTIGTDGLVGNKIISITASAIPGEMAKPNDILPSKKPVDTEEMIETASNTNKNLLLISDNLKIATGKINASRGFWKVMEDSEIHQNVTKILSKTQLAISNINQAALDIVVVTDRIKNGKGVLGQLVNDSITTYQFNNMMNQAESSLNNLNIISSNTKLLVKDLKDKINDTTNLVGEILNNEIEKKYFQKSMMQINLASEKINQLLEGLKQSGLFKRFFKKQIP
jgi:phospholipid/cholesterol/gamma-HCH transport system substrate-binding protein